MTELTTEVIEFSYCCIWRGDPNMRLLPDGTVIRRRRAGAWRGRVKWAKEARAYYLHFDGNPVPPVPVKVYFDHQRHARALAQLEKQLFECQELLSRMPPKADSHG